MAIVNTWIQRSDYQLIYDHLLDCVQNETPQQVMERFRALFIMGYTYPDRAVQGALDQIVGDRNAERNFKLFINRCCHILVNRWQKRPLLHGAIPEFLTLLETPIAMPAGGLSRATIVRRLRLLFKGYLESEYYQKLQRIAQFVGEDHRDLSAIRRNSDRPLSSLIRRYPYLYDHCLIGDETTAEEKSFILKSQSTIQQQFELDLSSYLTTEFRIGNGNTVIDPVKNPTLLSDVELKTSLKHFVGKVDGRQTYRDIAQQFNQQTAKNKSTEAFKREFYHYLTDTSGVTFGNGRFRQRFQQYIDTLPALQQSHQLNEFALVRTCSQTLNYLVVDSAQNPNHLVFVDLLNNIGTPATVGLLLKIVLVSKKVKPYLEKRFAILFNHYQSFNRGKVKWLVNCLENFNIATATHFGRQDFSFFSKL